MCEEYRLDWSQCKVFLVVLHGMRVIEWHCVAYIVLMKLLADSLVCYLAECK